MAAYPISAAGVIAGIAAQTCLKTNLPIIRLNTSVDMSTKSHTSGKYLPIDISFINIYLWSMEKSRLNQIEKILKFLLLMMKKSQDFRFLSVGWQKWSSST